MEQMWQVCELEESGNIRLTHFERFSVTAVPENWIIILLDGSLLCFWPSVDAASKIRSLHPPEIGKKCKYYKCRILLDGAKFSSYEKAEEAVQIAQNVSSIMDSSILMGTQEIQNTCKSTMNFDVTEYENLDENGDDIDERDNSGFNVSEADTGYKNAIAKADGFHVSDTDDVNGEIIGCDSFEFNKGILKGGHYLSKKAMSFEVEDLVIPTDANYSILSENFDYVKFQSNDVNFSTSTAINKGISKWGHYLSKKAMSFEVEDLVIPTDANYSILSENFDYVKFQSNDVHFSTSTATDDMDFQQTIKKLEPSEIMLKISAIEMKVSLFVKSIQDDLYDLKEAVRLLKKRETKVVQGKDVSSNSGFRNLVRKEEMRFINGDESNVQREKTGKVPLNPQSTLALEDVHYENALNKTFATKAANVQEHASDGSYVQLDNVELVPLISPAIVELTKNAANNTFVLKSTNVSAHVSDESPKILNIEILPVVDLNVRKVSVDGEAQANLIDEPDFDSLSIDELRFPYDKVDDHLRNETLLGEPDFDSALAKFLEPFCDEDEATYMERSVRKVFTEDFFLNSVLWRNQPECMNIKHSCLLSCWKKSFGMKFKEINDDKKFHGHFRRLKSKIRARIKSQNKRLAKAAKAAKAK